MINLRLAECAVVLDRHRSFARAAVTMGVTQPTFSRSIALLEADVGVRLFDRTSRRVEPTAEGRLFLARARSLLVEADRLRDALTDLQSLRAGELIVGVGPYPLVISVIEAVGRLTAQFPAIRVEVIEDQWRDLMSRLLSGEVGVVVAETSLMASEPRLVVESLPTHTGRLFCRAGHPLLGRRNPTVRQVLQYPLVGARLPGRFAKLFHDSPSAAMPDPLTGDFLPQITTTSFATARALVMRTDGIGIAPLASIAEDIRREALAALDVDSAVLESQYGIARLRDRTASPAEMTFMQLVRDVEAELASVERTPPTRRATGHMGRRPTARKRS